MSKYDGRAEECTFLSATAQLTAEPRLNPNPEIQQTKTKVRHSYQY